MHFIKSLNGQVVNIRDRVKILGKIAKKINLTSRLALVTMGVSIYRLLFMWRLDLSAPRQDEINWINQIHGHSFFRYLMLRDSGYPVPALRGGIWIIHILFAANSALAIHVCAAIMCGLSLSTILLIRSISTFRRLLVIGGISTFPSADLLLWHNVSYFTYIACVILILHLFVENYSKKIRYYFAKYSLLSILLFTSTKPQLLVSIIGALLVLLFRRIVSRNYLMHEMYFQTILIVAAAMAVIVGRGDRSALNLTFGGNFLLKIVISLPVLIGGALIPFVSLAVIALLKKKLAVLALFVAKTLIFTLGIASPMFVSVRRRKLNTSKITIWWQIVLLVAAIPIIFANSIFPNSGWSQSNYFNASCISCLYQRHYLPFLSLYLLIMASISPFLIRKNSLYILFVSLIGQHVILNQILFQKIFNPNI